MPYREYKFEDGSILVVEINDSNPEPSDRIMRGGPIPKSQSLGEKIGDVLDFDNALTSAQKSVHSLQKAFEQSTADQVEIKFGLKATGEFGNFAIAKTGIEANYEVTLVWKKKDISEKK